MMSQVMKVDNAKLSAEMKEYTFKNGSAIDIFCIYLT